LSEDIPALAPIVRVRVYCFPDIRLASVTLPKQFHLEISMLSIFRKLMKNEDGATAIEYVLIASLISVAAIVAMQTVGHKVSNVLSNVANAMT
jgi:pilus assembly protein Flp/PilA